MSKLADDLCAEVRHQCEQAEHFKGLWMESNEELEKTKKQRDKLLAALDIQPQSPIPMTEAELSIFKLGWLECRAAAKAVIAEVRGDK